MQLLEWPFRFAGALSSQVPGLDAARHEPTTSSQLLTTVFKPARPEVVNIK